MNSRAAREDRQPPISISDLQGIASGLPPKTVLIAGGDRKEDLAVAKSLQALPFAWDGGG